jgi:hypothetical protein
MKILFFYFVFTLSNFVHATSLICRGEIEVVCNPNPYVPQPYGFCGFKLIDDIRVDIREKSCKYPDLCGSVSIQGGNNFFGGEYLITISDKDRIYIDLAQEPVIRMGIIYRSGKIFIAGGKTEKMGEYGFKGNCEANKKLF